MRVFTRRIIYYNVYNDILITCRTKRFIIWCYLLTGVDVGCDVYCQKKAIFHNIAQFHEILRTKTISTVWEMTLLAGKYCHSPIKIGDILNPFSLPWIVVVRVEHIDVEYMNVIYILLYRCKHLYSYLTNILKLSNS